jgi:hypothetical protein
MAGELAILPDTLEQEAGFALFRGIAAQEREDWAAAAREFERAVEHDPTDFGALVRLARALRFAGEVDRADQYDARVATFRGALSGLLTLYEEADQTRTLGVAPHPDLCERLARSREAMGRPDEASLWRRIGPGIGSGSAQHLDRSAAAR